MLKDDIQDSFAVIILQARLTLSAAFIPKCGVYFCA